MSPQNVETKEKIAAAKCNGETTKKPEEEKGLWESLTPEVSTVPKTKDAQKKAESMTVEFPKLSGVDATGYDFSFDPEFVSLMTI